MQMFLFQTMQKASRTAKMPVWATCFRSLLQNVLAWLPFDYLCHCSNIWIHNFPCFSNWHITLYQHYDTWLHEAAVVTYT